ncbi:MAG: mevalonate kinase [Candidatus Micrarchaeaceae archaeon]
MEIEASAPGVIKLLGEHAVVYGKLSLAMAINIYATAHAEDSSGFLIELADIGEKKKFSIDELNKLYRSFMSRKSIEEYVANNSAYANFLPFATILASANAEFGIDFKRIVLRSKIPIKKGFASSAALSTAMAVALLEETGSSDQESVELARIGEIVMHRSEGAGRIDINTSYLGGFVTYSHEEGAKKLNSNVELKLLAIDTGPKKSTAETVGHVAYLMEHKKADTERTLNKIEACTKAGLLALTKGDIKLLGEEMFKDHEFLKTLGVSSTGLDKAVELARKNGSYGAKLSGGGGGGIAIAINTEGLEEAMKDSGFNCMRINVSLEGAKKLKKAIT